MARPSSCHHQAQASHQLNPRDGIEGHEFGKAKGGRAPGAKAHPRPHSSHEKAYQLDHDVALGLIKECLYPVDRSPSELIIRIFC